MTLIFTNAASETTGMGPAVCTKELSRVQPADKKLDYGRVAPV